MNEDEETPEEDPRDGLAALRAELDQAMMLAPEQARLARAMYDAYEEEGFSEQQALYLTAVQMVRDPGTAP